jgi:hypothetical protein
MTLDTNDAAQDALGRLEVEFHPVELKAALLASRVWKTYRNRSYFSRLLVLDPSKG